MTQLDDGTIVTNIDATDDNANLTRRGYTIRHVETWHREEDSTFIIWDGPEITEADLPL